MGGGWQGGGLPLAENKLSIFDGLAIGYIYSYLSIDYFFVPMHRTKNLQLYKQCSVFFFSKMAFLKKRA